MTTFSSINLPGELRAAIDRLGFKTPTPIQAQTIPLALQGHDILGTSQTGTGKTAAFALPLITRLIDNPKDTAMIITPTRELAMQIMELMNQLTPMKKALLIGGANISPQISKLRERPRIMIGTPGRINDHIGSNRLNLSQARFLVLDEADRMIDMGFGRQIDKILAIMPKDRQTLMFSATIADNMLPVTKKYLRNPKRISVGSTTNPIDNITQSNILTNSEKKFDRMVEEIAKMQGSVIMFVKTKHGADRMAKKLSKQNFTSSAIHGDLRQSKRANVLEDFRKYKYQILVATDIAARGLDIPHIENVVNYDLPMCPEDYIHRIGRTARAGKSGNAINFITKNDEKLWKAIQKMMGLKEKRA